MAEKHLSNRYKNPKGSCVGGLLYRIEYSLRLKNVSQFNKILFEQHTELLASISYYFQGHFPNFVFANYFI